MARPDVGNPGRMVRILVGHLHERQGEAIRLRQLSKLWAKALLRSVQDPAQEAGAPHPSGVLQLQVP